MSSTFELIDRLALRHKLELLEYAQLITSQNDELQKYAAALADKARREYYGNSVYVRGLIEVGNVCRNNCYYCGIRRDNKKVDRYILTREEILSCCREGYALGFRTFVLQGGEGVMPVDEICATVREIKKNHPDCAVTLSFGEYEKFDYEKMRRSGADRYLLRHETANDEHYAKLHPENMTLKHRTECLKALRELGFQVGCGFMVGSPYQTPQNLAEDLKFIESFSPDMCGVGPFIPHCDTPLGGFAAGGLRQTVFLLSLIRLIKPNILLPATTALGTIADGGRELGILSGANVVMPNLSPISVREKYALYENKICTGDESAQALDSLRKSMAKIGYEIITDRGDVKSQKKEI